MAYTRVAFSSSSYDYEKIQVKFILSFERYDWSKRLLNQRIDQSQLPLYMWRDVMDTWWHSLLIIDRYYIFSIQLKDLYRIILINSIIRINKHH